MRFGHGIDVHAFDSSSDRTLRLGGVAIPGQPGLSGHSDADVVLHALTDALLGAVAEGDLGSLVGVDTAATKGADSAAFVNQAVAAVGRHELAIGNVDVTVVAQRPRLAPYRAAMRQRIADLLTVTADQVSVKATTSDHLGFLGQGEGIGCLATVLLTPDRHPSYPSS